MLSVARGQQVDSSVNDQLQGVQVSAQANPTTQPKSISTVSSNQSGGAGRYELRMNSGVYSSGPVQDGKASESALSAASLSSATTALSASGGSVGGMASQSYRGVGRTRGPSLASASGGSGEELGGVFPDSTRGTAALGSGWDSEASLFSLSTRLPAFDPVFSDHQFNPNINVVSNRAAYHGTSPSEESSWVSWFTNPYEYIYSLYGISEPGSQGLVQASDLQTHLIDWSDMELQYTLHPGVMSEVELQQAGTLHMNSGTGY